MREQELQLVDPCARSTLQELFSVCNEINTAVTENDLCAAIVPLHNAVGVLKQLLPKIRDVPYIYQAQAEILSANIELNKKLACKKADINDVATYMENVRATVTEAVSKQQAAQNKC